MKKLLYLTFLISICAISACKKEDGKPDFRDSYIGKYELKEYISCYGSAGSCYSEKDVILSLDYGASDSSLSFVGKDNILLDSDGRFFSYHYAFRIWGDSLYSYESGPLGGGKNIEYYGAKISNIP